MNYRCQTTSVEGFVQQLACNYLPHGYWFYAAGWLPAGKDAEAIDHKLIHKYGVAVSRASRSRRKQAGLANVQYLRFERFFLLLATHGRHPFFAEEAATIRDARRVPIQFAGYAISVKRGQYLRRDATGQPAVADGRYRVRVRIARDPFTELKAYFGERAMHDSAEHLAAQLYSLPFEPYAPVRQQALKLLAIVNKRRKIAGLPAVPLSAIRLRRRIVQPFAASQADLHGDASRRKLVESPRQLALPDRG